MKRIFITTAAVIALALAVSGLMLAQGADPLVGTWKLNLAKSKYTGMLAPKSETRTIEAQGKAFKVSFDGIAADGSRIAYSFTSNFDGKPVPVSGSGIPGGADMEAVKRLNSRTTTTTATKAGKVVGTVRTVVSADGKVTTQTRKDPDGKVAYMGIWDKQ